MTYDRRLYTQNSYLQDRSIECCRNGRLVYVRTLKCASEFFWRNFTETMHWQTVPWHSIDWHNDTVFSYVMDPILRRHKGLAEWLVITHCQQQFMQDMVLQKIISHTPFLDAHSASLATIYGERMMHIEWLPITADHDVAITITNQLLQRHAHPAVAWNPAFVHQTDCYMKDIFERIKTLWDTSYPDENLIHYFAADVQAWELACQRYNINPTHTVAA